MSDNDVCEHQNANYLRMMSERDDLRAEVERLREVSAAQPYETERELAVALNEARRQVADLRAEQERHALANDGCVPGAAYRDLAAAHADLRAGIEALAAEFEKPCPSTLAYRSEVVRAVRALLAGSGERPGERDTITLDILGPDEGRDPDAAPMSGEEVVRCRPASPERRRPTMTARDCTHPSRTWDGWFESCRKCGACAGDRRGPDGLRYATFDEEADDDR